MNLRETMKALEAAGTAQNRKVYANHGVGPEMFGVSYAHLGKLKKRIGTDQALAEQLWSTGNHDARILATMIADPDGISAAAVDRWAKDLDNYVLTDAFIAFVAGTRHAAARAGKWTRSRAEFLGQAGWGLLSGLVRDGQVPDAECAERIAEIEERIHAAKNRVRHSMNGALINIGLRSAALEKKAIAAAGRIGKVEVDHGKTSCKTPDAADYIRKTRAHYARQRTATPAAKASKAAKSAPKAATRK